MSVLMSMQLVRRSHVFVIMATMNDTASAVRLHSSTESSIHPCMTDKCKKNTCHFTTLFKDDACKLPRLKEQILQKIISLKCQCGEMSYFLFYCCKCVSIVLQRCCKLLRFLHLYLLFDCLYTSVHKLEMKYVNTRHTY